MPYPKYRYSLLQQTTVSNLFDQSYLYFVLPNDLYIRLDSRSIIQTNTKRQPMQTTYSIAQQSKVLSPKRRFTPEDIDILLEKIFNQFDGDKNQRFTKNQFPIVVRSLINMVGGEEPARDDLDDLFNLLDVNGDETIDRKEFKSLLMTFFKLLNEKQIDVSVDHQTDILY